MKKTFFKGADKMKKKRKVTNLLGVCFAIILTGCSQTKTTESNSNSYQNSNSSSVSLPNLDSNSSSSSNVEEPLQYYTYRFYDAENIVIKEDTILEGEPIIPPETNPEKKKTSQFTYTFSKWSLDDFSAISKDEDIYPIYIETINQYTYTFLNYDDSVLKQVTADYGTTIIAPEDPTYSKEEELIYTFIGWDQDFSLLTQDITIKAMYSIQTDVQKQAFNIVRSAFEKNQIITITASLQEFAALNIQMQFSISDEVLQQLLSFQIVTIEQLLQAVTLKAIITYNDEVFLVEINPSQSYLSYKDKVYQVDLLKTYQTLIDVLPKEVFDIVSFLEQLMKQEIPVKDLSVEKTEKEATIHVVIDCSNIQTSTTFTSQNEFQCDATFSINEEAYAFSSASMSFFNQTLQVSLLEKEFIFEINYDNALNWLDCLLAFAPSISKTAQLKDFHLTGKIQLSATALVKADIAFDIKISIDENQHVFAILDLTMSPNWLGTTIIKENTHSLVYIDQSQSKIYLNRTTKEVLIKTWTFEEFQADMANNIFDILNASDSVRSNSDAQATVVFSELINNITLNEDSTLLTITINKDAITLTKEESSLSVSKDFVIAIATNSEGYLSSISLSGAVALSVFSLNISMTNASLVDIGESFNVSQIIQDALEAGTITH